MHGVPTRPFRRVPGSLGARQPRPRGASRPTASELDAVLDAERIGRDGKQVTYAAPLESLPDGCFVTIEGDQAAYLALGDHLLRWSPWGYDRVDRRPVGLAVQVLTPRPTVAALAAGYTPWLRESARTTGTHEG